MKKLIPVFIFFAIFYSCQNKKNESLMVFAGAAGQPAIEEAAKLFTEKNGIETEINFGGSGYVLSQMILSRKGDVYFPGSSDYMEIAKEKQAVFPETETEVVYLVPAINVPKGNPKQIYQLADLTRENLKVAIANPEGVCVGVYAIEIIEKNFTEEQKKLFRKNIVNYTGSCSQTATAVSLKTVDAVLGWQVFEHWDSTAIETVRLDKSQIVRIGYIPAAVSTFTENRENAQKFIDFLKTEDCKNIFRKHKYFMSPEEAFEYIGEAKEVGGTYKVPEIWFDMQAD